MLELPKGVVLASYSLEKLTKLWDKMRHYDSLFVHDDTRNPETFVKQFLDPATSILEIENGIMLMRKIVPHLSGEVHFSFFDHKLSPRTELLKECLIWAFLTYDLERIDTQVADYAHAIKSFLTRKMNFVHEGKMRNKARHNGNLIDVHIYSILKREVMI